MKTHTTSSKNNKKQYRIRNWKEYNQALVNRGSLTFWIGEDVMNNWNNADKTGKPGRPIEYSPVAIQTSLVVQALFHQPLRQTEGLLNSMFHLAEILLTAPDYSTVSKRGETLSPDLARRSQSKKAKHVVIDSSGVKIFGEGEWKVRQHGKSKRRTWRKVHLGIDEKTGEIVVAKATLNSIHDSEVLPELLSAIPDTIEQVSGDGAYDTRASYQAIRARNAYASIPPQANAKIWQHGNSLSPPHVRDRNLRRIREIGRKKWKVESGYHRRSLVETGFFRFKTIFGDKIPARKFAGQAAQILIRCRILNQMLTMGMPQSYIVA